MSLQSEVSLLIGGPKLLPDSGTWTFAGTPIAISTSANLAQLKSGQLEIDEPQLKAQVLRDANQQVVDATIAIRHNDQWLVVEANSMKPQRRLPHLLPLAGSCKRVCGRTDEKALLMEIVSLNRDRNSLLDAWRQAGWQLQHTAWGSSDSFSFLCVKGDKVVYAWSQQPQQITSLLLSRSRDIANQPATLQLGNGS